MLARALLAASCALFAPAVAAPVDASPPQLLVVVNGGPEVGFVVLGPDGADEPFAAGVLLSLQSDLMHFYVGLPPLLADSVLLGASFAGVGEAAILVLPAALFPARVPLFAQGVVLSNGGLAVTAVVPFEVTARSR